MTARRARARAAPVKVVGDGHYQLLVAVTIEVHEERRREDMGVDKHVRRRRRAGWLGRLEGSRCPYGDVR